MDLRTRQRGVHVIGHQSAHGLSAGEQAFKRRALIRQQKAHRLPAAEAELRHGVVLAAIVRGAVVRAVHEVDGLLLAACRGESVLSRRILPEFIAPLVLKIERRQKEHHGLGLCLDLARRVLQEIARVLIDPFADGLVRLLISHRGGEGRGEVLLGEKSQRLLVIGDVLVQPNGTAEQRLSR